MIAMFCMQLGVVADDEMCLADQLRACQAKIATADIDTSSVQSPLTSTSAANVRIQMQQSKHKEDDSSSSEDERFQMRGRRPSRK